MSGALEPITASTTALGVLKDVPLWLLSGVSAFLLMLPYLPGTGDLLSAIALGWTQIAGILFAILAAFRLVNALAPLARTWWAGRDERRTFYLTFDDTQSFWHVAKQQDGSMVTQFTLRFMAKNRTSAPVHLLKARVIRPKIQGEILQDLVLVRHIQQNIYGSARASGNYIPPAGLLPISITILIRGKPKQATGRLKTVVGVSDESGNEIRVKLALKGAP